MWSCNYCGYGQLEGEGETEAALNAHVEREHSALHATVLGALDTAASALNIFSDRQMKGFALEHLVRKTAESGYDCEDFEELAEMLHRWAMCEAV